MRTKLKFTKEWDAEWAEVDVRDRETEGNEVCFLSGGLNLVSDPKSTESLMSKLYKLAISFIYNNHPREP